MGQTAPWRTIPAQAHERIVLDSTDALEVAGNEGIQLPRLTPLCTSTSPKPVLLCAQLDPRSVRVRNAGRRTLCSGDLRLLRLAHGVRLTLWEITGTWRRAAIDAIAVYRVLAFVFFREALRSV
jgi:hypothetical protein